MNILFFLTPKKDVAYVYADDSLRQVIEKMEHHGFTAVPLLSMDGEYIGTLTEGDLLRKLRDLGFPPMREMEGVSVMEIPRQRTNVPVNVEADMRDLLDMVIRQNFVPVVDDNNVFIGIVTRKDVLTCLRDRLREE